MKIRITKSSSSGYWYADHIGQEFEVEAARETFILVKNPYGSENRFSYSVAACDCEIVKDQNEAKTAAKSNPEPYVFKAAFDDGYTYTAGDRGVFRNDGWCAGSEVVSAELRRLADELRKKAGEP